MKGIFVRLLKMVSPLILLSLFSLTACGGSGSDSNINREWYVQFRYTKPDLDHNSAGYSNESVGFYVKDGERLSDYVFIIEDEDSYYESLGQTMRSFICPFGEEIQGFDENHNIKAGRHIIAKKFQVHGFRYEMKNEFVLDPNPIHSSMQYVIDYVEGKYQVQWINTNGTHYEEEDDTVLDEQWLSSGSVPVYKGKINPKTLTDSEGRRFEGWCDYSDYYGLNVYKDGQSFPAVEHKDVKYYLEWGGCLVTFKNWDGTVLQNSYWLPGETPVYNGSTPTKPANEQYTYSFDSWKDTWGEPIRTITDDDNRLGVSFTFTATFTSTKNYYSVRWLNWDGTLLEQKNVTRGEYPEYTGSTPTRSSSEVSDYTFTGWDKSYTRVECDQVYTAQFEEVRHSYRITWANYNGNVLKNDIVKKGELPVYTGSTPTRSSDSDYDYTFTGWSPSITAATSDITYVAQYTRTERVHFYTVTWNNYDGTVLEIDTNVAAGTFPTYNGSTPTKPASGNYSYTFSGWTPALSNVYSDVTYTATFEEVEENPYENAVKAIGDKNLYLDNLSFNDGATTWNESLRSSTNKCEIYLSNDSSGTDGTYGYYYQTRSFHVTLTFDPTDKEKQVVSYEHYCYRFYEEESAHGEAVWMQATGSATVDLYRSKGDSIVLSNFGGSKDGVQYLIARLPSMTNTTEARRCGIVFDELLKQISQRVPVSLKDLGYTNY